jgi:hypothetical protein
MPLASVEKALAYLDALEIDRKAALALSEQKAEEAKLIKARQEGFQAAMEIFGGEVSVPHAGTDRKLKELVRRRGRRPIPQLILREMAFSGQPMTTAQIAKAIDYISEGTEMALKRMEAAGQVLQEGDGRWAIAHPELPKLKGHAYAA